MNVTFNINFLQSCQHIKEQIFVAFSTVMVLLSIPKRICHSFEIDKWRFLFLIKKPLYRREILHLNDRTIKQAKGRDHRTG